MKNNLSNQTSQQQIKKIRDTALSSLTFQFVSHERKQHTYERLVELFILTLRRLPFLSYSYKTIARLLGISKAYVYELYVRLKEDPRFIVGKALRRDKSKYYYTLKVSLSKQSKFFLFEYHDVRKNNYNDLSIDTSLSPKETKTVLKSEPSQTKKHTKEQKASLIHQLGIKHRMHYYNQTLVLYAFPYDVIVEAEQELCSALQEGIVIRSRFRYLRKILLSIMLREHLRPLWKLYYNEKAIALERNAHALPKKPQSPRCAAPLSPKKIEEALTYEQRIEQSIKALEKMSPELRECLLNPKWAAQEVIDYFKRQTQLRSFNDGISFVNLSK